MLECPDRALFVQNPLKISTAATVSDVLQVTQTIMSRNGLTSIQNRLQSMSYEIKNLRT